MGDPGSWAVERFREAPSAFHARSLPDDVERAVWVCDPDRPALVLGSAQRDAVVDALACQRAGVEVVRRRSGGGAVLVVPGDVVWLDVVLPADDPLWEVDVSRAFLWLGDVWAAALAELGVEVEVHRGGLVRTRWSDLVCFAGLGAGELTTVTGNGAPAKVVGLSQRRTRAGARFQCAALLRWDPDALIDLLDLSHLRSDEVADLHVELAAVARGTGLEPAPLLDAVLGHLPSH